MPVVIPRKINVIDMYHGNAVTTGGHDNDPAALKAIFTALKDAGVYGIIHKVSQGLNYADPAYQIRMPIAIACGLLWGGYHFLTSADPKAQADFFLTQSGITAANANPLLLACDFEDWPQAQPSLQQCMAFMKEIDIAAPPSVQCALYSGNVIRETLRPATGGHQDQAMVGVELFFQQHRLWLAEYGPKEQIPYPWNQPIPKSSNEAAQLPAPGVWLWQFTETGNVGPLPGKTDGNFYDGTADQLASRWLA